MSRKTKADLEAEIQVLQSDNGSLREMVGVLNEELDAEIKNRQIIESAFTATIAKLAKLSKGRVQREIKAFMRNKYLQSQYDRYRKEGFNITKSREKANDDMAEKYGDKHRLKERQLKKLKD